MKIKTMTILWIILALLAVLCPLGLIIPHHFKAGDAWGEWGTDTIKTATGYVPAGLEKLSSTWNAPWPDYSFKGWEDKGLRKLSVAYIFCAIAGIVFCVGISFIIGRLVARKETKASGS